MNYKFGWSDNVLPVLYFKPANISHDNTHKLFLCFKVLPMYDGRRYVWYERQDTDTESVLKCGFSGKCTSLQITSIVSKYLILNRTIWTAHLHSQCGTSHVLCLLAGTTTCSILVLSQRHLFLQFHNYPLSHHWDDNISCLKSCGMLVLSFGDLFL